MTPKQTKVLAALLEQPTKKAAAAAAGISPATLRRYLADEEFQREYKKGLAELLKNASDRAQKGMDAALEYLNDAFTGKQAAEAVKVQASRAFLAYGMQVINIADIEERLTKLERARAEAAEYYE